MRRVLKKFRKLFFNKKVSWLTGIKQDVPGLCYHSFSNIKSPNNGLHNVTTENFSIQLKELYRRKISVLPLDEFMEERFKSKSKITAITFDDGYQTILTEAFPVLEHYRLPFTMFLIGKCLKGELYWRDKLRLLTQEGSLENFKHFVYYNYYEIFKLINWENFFPSTKDEKTGPNTKTLEKAVDDYLIAEGIDRVNENYYLNHEDLKQFPKDLVTIGNHTQNHYKLATLSKDEQKAEIVQCQQLINTIDLPQTKHFGIPFGGNSTFNQDTIDVIHQLGFKGFLMTNQNQFGQKKPEFPFQTYDLNYSNRILPPNKSFYA